MLRVCIIVLIAVFVAVIFTECDKVKITPAPEVAVVWFNPLGEYVIPGQVSPDTGLEVWFKVWNYVDARVTQVRIDYRSVANNDVVASDLDMSFDLFLTGGTSGCVEESLITILYNLYFDISEAVDYIYANNDNVVAEITFSGVDAYGEEKEFSCNLHYGLMKAPSFAENKRGVPKRQE